ncbi:unnamed protein product [Nezara viridula]|nr:unnamed protein product [Nezara viridula]
MGLMMHHTVLKLLESEALILKAICHRYVEKGLWNFTSPCGARLLDYFHSLITFLAVDNLDTNLLDPNITSELMFLSGQLIDHFMCGIEPTLDLVVPFEVKLADILDSCNDASVNYQYSEWDIGYRLNINYYFKNLASLQFPWDVFQDVSTENKLKHILKTMKSSIRYRNYCYPLREAWYVEDIFDVRGINGLKNFLNEPRHYHLRGNQEQPCNKVHDWYDWQIGEDGWTKVYDEIHQQKPYSLNTHRMDIEIKIEGGPKPLKFQHDLVGEREDEIGICDIYLYVQHPSKCDFCNHVSCIKIQGKNGIYSIQANDHHQHDS